MYRYEASHSKFALKAEVFITDSLTCFYATKWTHGAVILRHDGSLFFPKSFHLTMQKKKSLQSVQYVIQQNKNHSRVGDITDHQT